LPELSAADRECVRHQHSDRDGPSRAALRRAAAGLRSPQRGKKQKIWRCPGCQTAVFSQYTRLPIRFVRAGTLDEPAAVAPDVHIFTRSKLPWVTLPDSVPAFDVYYDTKKLWPAASLERVDALTGAK
jgi:hypothetical protein